MSMAFIQNDLSVQTHYEWLSQLNIENRPKNNYRRTSIICTIGPKTNSVDAINRLRKGKRLRIQRVFEEECDS